MADVRCLQCGGAYAKPVGAGTVESNPGCPFCNYLGWGPVEEPVRSDFVWRLPAGSRKGLQPITG